MEETPGSTETDRPRANVRRGTPADATIMARMIRALASHIGESSPITLDCVTTYLANSENGVLLAEVNGHVVGLLTFHIHPNLYHAGETCLIEELFVDQEMRGHGVGKALIDALFKEPRVLGCAEVSVSTTTENDQAIRFYRRHGFVDEAVLLERHLPPKRQDS